MYFSGTARARVYRIFNPKDSLEFNETLTVSEDPVAISIRVKVEKNKIIILNVVNGGPNHGVVWKFLQLLNVIK